MQKQAKLLLKSGEKTNFLNAKKLYDNGLKEIFVSNRSLYGKFLHKDIIVMAMKHFEIGTELNETIIQKILENNIHQY